MQDLAAVLNNLAMEIVNFIPNLVGAVALLVIGYIVGKVIGVVIKGLCDKANVDRYIRSKGFRISELLKLAGEWIIYLVFIQSAVQFLGIVALANFVNEIIYFIPKAVGAAIIIIVGYILGNFFEEQIKASEGIYSDLIGRVVNFFTVYVAIALALPFLGINPSLVNNILLIIIGSVGLGFALAIGLGMKDIVAKEASKYIGKLEKKTQTQKKRR